MWTGWRARLVPTTTSEQHAIRPLIVGFLMEALTEIYQFVTTARSIQTTVVGYYLSLVATIAGFYFLWRGIHEWNRLRPRPKLRAVPRPIPWIPISMLLGGVVATALFNIGWGSVGAGDSPPLLAWIVAGVMVLAIGSFFLTLREHVAPWQRPTVQILGWVAFVWALGVSVIAGLALGQAIVGLFIDFFTNWTALILSLAPFIFAIAPLFVAYILLAIGYSLAYSSAPNGPTNHAPARDPRGEP